MVHSKKEGKQQAQVAVKENKNPSVVKVVKDWKGNQRGVRSLSSDPLKTQLVDAQSNLT